MYTYTSAVVDMASKYLYLLLAQNSMKYLTYTMSSALCKTDMNIHTYAYAHAYTHAHAHTHTRT